MRAFHRRTALPTTIKAAEIDHESVVGGVPGGGPLALKELRCNNPVKTDNSAQGDSP
jgi:hypothetical protein